MTKEKNVTEIKLELIVDETIKLKMSGVCNEQNPNMSSIIEWWHRGSPSQDEVILRGGKRPKSTLFERYSLMIDYVNKNYPKKSYEIKMSVGREK